MSRFILLVVMIACMPMNLFSMDGDGAKGGTLTLNLRGVPPAGDDQQGGLPSVREGEELKGDDLALPEPPLPAPTPRGTPDPEQQGPLAASMPPLPITAARGGGSRGRRNRSPRPPRRRKSTGDSEGARMTLQQAREALAAAVGGVSNHDTQDQK